MTASYEPIRPIANIGDIITVKGYGIRTFRVDSYTHERYIDAENDVDEIYYDCTCVKTFEPILANQEDVAVVKKEGGISKLSVEHTAYYEQAMRGLTDEVTRGAKDLAGIISNIQDKVERAAVDELLDDLSDAMALVEMFGDHEDDEKKDRKYAMRVCEIKAKLIDISVNNVKG